MFLPKSPQSQVIDVSAEDRDPIVEQKDFGAFKSA